MSWIDRSVWSVVAFECGWLCGWAQRAAEAERLRADNERLRQEQAENLRHENERLKREQAERDEQERIRRLQEEQDRLREENRRMQVSRMEPQSAAVAAREHGGRTPKVMSNTTWV
jgi:hypothetical protein